MAGPFDDLIPQQSGNAMAMARPSRPSQGAFDDLVPDNDETSSQSMRPAGNAMAKAREQAASPTFAEYVDEFGRSIGRVEHGKRRKSAHILSLADDL